MKFGNEFCQKGGYAYIIPRPSTSDAALIWRAEGGQEVIVAISFPVLLPRYRSDSAFFYLVMWKAWSELVSVPDPKPTPAWIVFSIVLSVILEVIYTPDEVWEETRSELADSQHALVRFSPPTIR